MDLFQNWRRKEIPRLLNVVFFLGDKVAAQCGNVIVAFDRDAVRRCFPTLKKDLPPTRLHPSSRY